MRSLVDKLEVRGHLVMLISGCFSRIVDRIRKGTPYRISFHIYTSHQGNTGSPDQLTCLPLVR